MKLNTPFGVFILVLYVSLHAANGILLKALALHGVTTSDALILRGLGCITLAVLIGTRNGDRMWPLNPALQAFRFLFSGLALFSLTAAYQYCNATSVAVISRLDTALLILAGPAIGVRAGKLQRALAMTCCLLLLGVALGGGIGPGESLWGYFLAIAGTIGITIGYLFLRASAKREPMPVVAWVAGAAILGYGCVTRAQGAPWPGPGLIALSLFAGVIMYGLYDLTVRLYQVMDVARAEYPTLFASLIVMALEATLLQVHFDLVYVASMVANVVLLGIVLGLSPRKEGP